MHVFFRQAHSSCLIKKSFVEARGNGTFSSILFCLLPGFCR